MSGAAAVRSARRGARGRRGLAAAALAGLGLLLQGCAGIAAQLPRSAQLDPATIAGELRAAQRGRNASTYGSVRPPQARFLEDVDTSARGQRLTYTYTQGLSACRPLVIGLSPLWPGCADVETYVIEGDRLVAASRKGYATYGLFCSPLLLFGLFDGVWPCWWEWG